MNKRSLTHFQQKFSIARSGCWQWIASKDKWGYGKFHLGKDTLAHRVSYKHFVGPLPDDLEIDHLCRNRSCVNPQHMEPVTKRENTLRGIAPSAINARKTHCQNGHKFTSQNTYMRPDGDRGCRQCNADASQRYRLRKSGKAVSA